AVDVIEFNPAIGGQGVGLMELLGQRAAMVGRVRSQGEDKQGTNGSQGSSQPSGRLAMTVHDCLRFNGLDAAAHDSGESILKTLFPTLWDTKVTSVMFPSS